MNTHEMYSQAVEGFKNGFGIDEFKKGETVYFWYKKVPAAELELKVGKVVEIQKCKNAAGRDVIRRVNVQFETDGPHDIIRGFGTIAQIKAWIFKKEQVEKPKADKVKETATASAPVVEEIEGAEIMWVEKAMSAKNPQVKKLVEEGWEYITKVWDGQKNMYLAKLQRSAS